MQKVMEQWTNIQILDFEWTSGDYPNISLLNLHMIISSEFNARRRLHWLLGVSRDTDLTFGDYYILMSEWGNTAFFSVFPVTIHLFFSRK